MPKFNKMSEEIELNTPKVNCGVWTAIENFINKENNEMIWDNKNVPKVSVTRKKEKFKASRKYLPSTIPTCASRRGSSRRSSVRIMPGQNATAIANAFAQKALVLRNTRNEYAEEVFEKSKRLLQTCNIPIIDCSFNLPRVNAQLERIMGSNVVHLTDKKYMSELRRRITEDFENMLTKRIHQRKAEEVQRQRVLLMEGKLPKCPKELKNHPVLVMNESTTNFAIKRRARLKTERERVSERMNRLAKKWEAEHILWEERERQNEVEMKLKEMELLSTDKSLVKKLENAEKRRALVKCFRRGTMNMENFLATETALMLNRLKPKEKKFIPFTRDIRVVDAKRRMSEASVQKLKSIAAKLRASDTEGTFQSENSDDNTNASQMDSDTASQASTKPKKSKGIFSFFKLKKLKADQPNKSQEDSPEKTKSITSEDDVENIQTRDIYMDPVIAKLKSAKNVRELYSVAEKIVGINIENILDKSKSDEGEDDAT
ncbi:uncharacterized protein LOC116346466 [Contarinia nasturtii]|uniref:uncharacterized protein LOC116346466 n=1 Tax=Contarinia nasturtii TaxID=265458 RepID=UPI0012D3BC3C|nr:uncharacterized protein LOC116346466 [Contarinia nasturtii]